MPPVGRARKVFNQYVTADLDASTVILLPTKNRHRFFLAAHPDNTQPVWVHLVDGTTKAVPKGTAIGDATAGMDADCDMDATAANSGVVIGVGGNFGDDLSGQFIFDGAISAIGSAAGQKLVVLEY